MSGNLTKLATVSNTAQQECNRGSREDWSGRRDFELATREIYSFGPYALLILFVVSSMFIGLGFFLAARIAQRLVFFGFVLWRYIIRATFGSQWLYRRFATLQGIPAKRTVFIRVLSKLIFWAREQFSTEARPVLRCLRTATERLLKERYGIETDWRLHGDGSDWGVWYSVLGKPLKSAQEGMLVSRTFLGCGWAGFTALYVSPALRERYFVGLCSAFALAGLLVSIALAFWNFNADFTPEVLKNLQGKGVGIKFHDANSGSIPLTLLGTWAPLILLGALWFFMIRQMQTGGNNALSRARLLSMRQQFKHEVSCTQFMNDVEQNNIHEIEVADAGNSALMEAGGRHRDATLFHTSVPTNHFTPELLKSLHDQGILIKFRR